MLKGKRCFTAALQRHEAGARESVISLVHLSLILHNAIHEIPEALDQERPALPESVRR